MLSFLLITPLLASLASAWPTLPKLLDQFAHRLPQQHAEPDNATGWADPRDGGGRMLDWVSRRYGEPLNVIISGRSDPRILSLSGLHKYANSIGYAEECLGLHYGRIHKAHLGDDQGWQDEQFLARQTYFPIFGTCWESVVGGHHWRAWQQNGTKAWFLSVSQEMDGTKNHRIVPNGYNLGRDWFVERALEGSTWKGMWWQAEVEWQPGLLEPGHRGINHNISQDGLIAIVTVHRL
ncbi:hypothetical protein JB92DRAFT_2807462 [Gautieria morchelliformis]|nr:hypothetical protein JB92DRAFT_2807462 [Gautieria morchelliformis]